MRNSITVDLGPHRLRQLNGIAKRHGASKSFLVRLAVQTYIDRYFADRRTKPDPKRSSKSPAQSLPGPP